MIACVDLFCGVGGLTHGLIRGGINVVAGIDVDPECRFPYEANNAATFLEKDVSCLSGDELPKLWPNGSVSMLAGCAPCQSFSTYSRKGRKQRIDNKWRLAAEFGRLIHETSPDIVTMENVPQLLDHQIFNRFLESLSDYHVWSRVVECYRYGIPQTRKRLVLLASRFGPISLREPSIDDEKLHSTVRNAISRLPNLKAGEFDKNDRLHWACKLSDINLRRIRASKPGGTWRDWPEELIAGCHQKKSGATYPSVYGRMEWNQPAPTITTQCFGYGNGRFGHPDQDRAITLREAALLQTFPRTYKFLPEGKRPAFYIMGRLIGNAVPVRLGEVIAQSVLRHLAETNPGKVEKRRVRRPQT